jgi:hypothetical protein
MAMAAHGVGIYCSELGIMSCFHIWDNMGYGMRLNAPPNRFVERRTSDPRHLCGLAA